MSRVAPQAGVFVSLTPGHVSTAGVDRSDVRHFEQALRVEPADRVKPVDERAQVMVSPVPDRNIKGPTDDLVQLLLERFGNPANGRKADGLALREYMREHIKLGTRQQTALLEVWAKLEGRADADYLADLIRDNLKWLIPRNGMISNLQSHSCKPDLE